MAVSASSRGCNTSSSAVAALRVVFIARHRASAAGVTPGDEAFTPRQLSGIDIASPSGPVGSPASKISANSPLVPILQFCTPLARLQGPEPKFAPSTRLRLVKRASRSDVR